MRSAWAYTGFIFSGRYGIVTSNAYFSVLHDSWVEEKTKKTRKQSKIS